MRRVKKFTKIITKSEDSNFYMKRKGDIKTEKGVSILQVNLEEVSQNSKTGKERLEDDG